MFRVGACVAAAFPLTFLLADCAAPCKHDHRAMAESLGCLWSELCVQPTYGKRAAFKGLNMVNALLTMLTLGATNARVGRDWLEIALRWLAASAIRTSRDQILAECTCPLRRRTEVHSPTRCLTPSRSKRCNTTSNKLLRSIILYRGVGW
jgi:hypothetical protein